MFLKNSKSFHRVIPKHELHADPQALQAKACLINETGPLSLSLENLMMKFEETF